MSQQFSATPAAEAAVAEDDVQWLSIGGGTAGTGGGGAGGVNAAGSNGTANSGGGGGGAFGYSSTSRNNGSGGSGIVIIRYPNTYTIAQSRITLTTATDGSDKVTTITAGTGTVSWS